MSCNIVSGTSHYDTSQASRESENVKRKWSSVSITIVYIYIMQFFSSDYYSFYRHTPTNRHSFKNI